MFAGTGQVHLNDVETMFGSDGDQEFRAALDKLGAFKAPEDGWSAAVIERFQATNDSEPAADEAPDTIETDSADTNSANPAEEYVEQDTDDTVEHSENGQPPLE